MSVGPRPAPRRGLDLRGRLTVALGAAIVVSVAAVAVVAYVLLDRALTSAARTAAAEEARAAAAVVRAELETPDPPSLDAIDRELAAIGHFEVVIATPDRVATSTPALDVGTVPAALRTPTAEPQVQEVEVAGRSWLVTAIAVGSDTALYLYSPLEATQRDLTIAGEIIALTAVVVAVLGLAASAAVGRRVLAPVEATAAAARQLAAGALHTRVPEVDPDPNDLTAAFNEMAAALQEMVASLEDAAAAQRRFVADVSHELRTPVTALSAATDLVEPQLDRLDGSARRAGQLLVAEVRGLRSLVEDLMEISRLDAQLSGSDLEAVDLSDLLPRVLAQRGHDEGVTWEVEDGALPRADPRRLSVVVGNLIDNALRHGDPPVEVRARRVGDAVQLDVSDHGGGIPRVERDRVFDRFAKLDQARTRSRGSGLGLAIVRDHVRAMGGSVEVVDSDRAPSCVRVTLPGWDPVQPD